MPYLSQIIKDFNAPEKLFEFILSNYNLLLLENLKHIADHLSSCLARA